MRYSKFTDSERDSSWGASLFSPFFIVLTAFLTSCASTKPLTSDQKSLSQSLSSASFAYDADDYSVAAKHLTKALVLAEDVAPSKIRKIRKRLSNVYLDWARSLYWKAKSSNTPEPMARAIRLCAMAAKVNPRSKRKCDTYAAKFRSDLGSIRYKNSTALEKLEPSFAERQYKVDLFRKQAKVLMNAGNYMSAKDKIEEVLRLDPYNIEATRDLRKLMKLVAQAGTRRASADNEERNAEVAWKNVAPVESDTPERIDEKLDSILDLKARLNDLKLPKIDFKDAHLENVLAMLQQEIRESVSKKFKFNYKGFDPTDKKWPLITFKAKDIPVLGALRAICGGIGLSFSCSNDTIDLSPK